MTYEFFTITDKLEEKVITTAKYKLENKLYLRFIKEADKFFGKDNWDKKLDFSNCLSNTLGWYAQSGYNTLEVRPVF